MSRIGKLPIKIPENVEVNCLDSSVIIKGKFGTLETKIPQSINIKHDNESKVLKVNIKTETKNIKALHGLYRTLINNMIIGVSKQFQITLTLQGVGYRAVVQSNSIILNLGYSHPVKIEIPNGISVEITQNTIINLKGCDKQELGLFASSIRSWRKPEPYKGKGILYKNEVIIRKAGKSGK